MGTASVIFAVYEAVLFYLIHVKDAEPGNLLRYSCIIAAAVFAWVTLLIEIVCTKLDGEPISKALFSLTDGNLLRIAMLFTLAADYFLVAMEKADNNTGVAVFLGTQLFIFLHIIVNDRNKNSRIINSVLRLVLSILLVIAAIVILGKDADSLAITSVIYYANLCISAIFAHRIGKGGIMLTIGLILFALCDVNVALSGIENVYGGFPEGSLLYNLVNGDVDLIWLFYIPSQALIPMTLIFSKNEKRDA